MPGRPPIRCRVRQFRESMHLSQSAAAARVGISRQALAAIENGQAVPSTTIALALAATLGHAVEELFQLESAGIQAAAVGHPPGTRLALAHVGAHWVGHALAASDSVSADALVRPDGAIEMLTAPPDLENRALVAGCAPLLGALVGHLQGRAEASARWLLQSSGRSLDALAAGRVHMAGFHLAAWDDPRAHERLVRERIPGEPLEIVTLVGWREGLAMVREHPPRIDSAADLGAAGVRVAQRAPDAGATVVLHAALAAAGLAPADIRGPRVSSHGAAALAVRHGAVHAAVVAEPVAAAHDLRFLPLSEERFELVFRSRDRAHPGVKRLLDRLTQAAFAREVSAMGAHDTTQMGDVRLVGAA